MSWDDSILLNLRREFSGKEKYKLFLQQLDRLETQLRAENKEILRLKKDNLELRQKNNDLKERNGKLQQENDKFRVDLGEWTATGDTKKFVNKKAYNQMEMEKIAWEMRYWELHRELQILKNGSIPTTLAGGIPTDQKPGEEPAFQTDQPE